MLTECATFVCPLRTERTEDSQGQGSAGAMREINGKIGARNDEEYTRYTYSRPSST